MNAEKNWKLEETISVTRFLHIEDRFIQVLRNYQLWKPGIWLTQKVLAILLTPTEEWGIQLNGSTCVSFAPIWSLRDCKKEGLLDISPSTPSSIFNTDRCSSSVNDFYNKQTKSNYVMKHWQQSIRKTVYHFQSVHSKKAAEQVLKRRALLSKDPD